MADDTTRWWRRPLSWPAQHWTALTAIVISVCALVLSIDSARQDREHKRLSVRPVISISFSYTDDGAGFRARNVGLGPAIVKWFTVYVDDIPRSSWTDVRAALGMTDTDFRFGLFHQEMIYQPDSQSATVFWYTNRESAQQLIANRRRIRTEICYCSLYDECWVDVGRVPGRSPSDCSRQTRPHFSD